MRSYCCLSHDGTCCTHRGNHSGGFVASPVPDCFCDCTFGREGMSLPERIPCYHSYPIVRSFLEPGVLLLILSCSSQWIGVVQQCERSCLTCHCSKRAGGKDQWSCHCKEAVESCGVEPEPRTGSSSCECAPDSWCVRGCYAPAAADCPEIPALSSAESVAGIRDGAFEN